jgi:hypothetical protein
VVWDRPDDDIVDHFTPRNSWDFQGQKPYAQQPHGWRVSFINRDNGFTQDERIVYDDGYDETNATLFEGIEFPGVTDPDLIWKLGRRHIAQSRLRPGEGHAQGRLGTPDLHQAATASASRMTCC